MYCFVIITLCCLSHCSIYYYIVPLFCCHTVSMFHPFVKLTSVKLTSVKLTSVKLIFVKLTFVKLTFVKLTFVKLIVQSRYQLFQFPQLPKYYLFATTPYSLFPYHYSDTRSSNIIPLPLHIIIPLPLRSISLLSDNIH
jgi:hypothetical protein